MSTRTVTAIAPPPSVADLARRASDASTTFRSRGSAPAASALRRLVRSGPVALAPLRGPGLLQGRRACQAGPDRARVDLDGRFVGHRVGEPGEDRGRFVV